MNAEQFLRKYFGLVGEYYTEEWKRMLAIKDEDERNAVMESLMFLDNGELDPNCTREFTREAWAAWGKALDMFNDLFSEGYIGSGPNGDYAQFFWECQPD